MYLFLLLLFTFSWFPTFQKLYSVAIHFCDVKFALLFVVGLVVSSCNDWLKT